MTHQLTAAALAELDQWEADGRRAVTNVVTEAAGYLAGGASPASVAYTVAHGAYTADPERAATGFGWAVVALAEQARQVAS